ncbi:MAG: hypothetical protein PHO74_05825, partial [Weeksellaceae bacterium]|nr:hypothetical protein [Weeksellaceae bacterium]
MKKIILAIAIVCFSTLLFGQEKEIDLGFEAIEANNVTQAKEGIEGIDINSVMLSPESKAKYCYTAGRIAMSEGRSIEAAKMFSTLRKYENGVVYAIKNKDSKDTEYYETRAEADEAYEKGNYNKPKELNLKPNLITKVEPLIRSKAETLLNQANSASQSNQSKQAGEKFLEASYLVDALGGDSDLFKYNAALSFHKANEFQQAFDIYNELIRQGYTGENTQWVGIDKETGEQKIFKPQDEANLRKNLGLVTDVKMVKSGSIEKAMFGYALNALSNLKKYDTVVET